VAAESSDPAAGLAAPGSVDREPRRRRPLLRVLQVATLALVVGLLALLVWRLTQSSRGSDLVAAIRADKNPPAPAFRLPVIWPHSETWPPALRPLLAAAKLSPAELRGRALIINFWASWCVPCRDEARRFAASAQAHAGKVVFLGVDVQDFTGAARRFLRKYGANYVSVRDGSGSTYDGYGLTGVPETYYLDSRGRIVAHSPGEVSRRELENGVRLASGASG
jgi:cytochrome c biogenesis protein CcmG/thiol:disulfide interchange protein DsbE